MPWAIIFGIVRAVAPSALSFVAGRWPVTAGPIMEILALLGTGGAATWSATKNTDSAKLAAVEAMPDVKKIVVFPNAEIPVAAAVADPSRPKVTTQ